MKKVPIPKHVLAVMIIGLVSFGYWYFAQHDDSLSDKQIRIATVSIKDQPQTDLYEHDMLFGPDGMWRAQSLHFQAMLKMFLVPTRHKDVFFPFRTMVPILSMIYLCGMYALLYRQCLSWASALFISILSTTIIKTLGSFYWGVGTLEMITPEGLCIALTPLLMFAYILNMEKTTNLRIHVWRGNWRLVLVFFAIGLLGNIDLTFAITFSLVLVFTYLFTNGITPTTVGLALICLLATFITSFWEIWYYIVIRMDLSSQSSNVARSAVVEALRLVNVEPRLSVVIREFLDWFVISGVLMLIAGGVLIRMERFRTRNLRFLIFFIFSSIFTAIVFYILASVAAALIGSGFAAIDFRMASIFAMPAIYLLACQALTNLSRLAKKHEVLLRWACALLLCIIMLPSDNLRVPRHKLYEISTMFMVEDDKPARIRRRRERAQQHKELMNMAGWVSKENNTDINSVFIFDSTEFRLHSRRSIVAGDDTTWIGKFCPNKLPGFVQLLQKQRRLLNPPAGKVDTDALRQFTRDLGEVKYWKGAKDWYVVLDAEVAPEESAWLKYINNDKWGKYLVLAKIQ